MASSNHVDRARREGVLLGIPLGDLGWFQSLLMGTAAGFAAFFATTFLSIIALLVYSGATHHTVDFAWSYKRVGFPVGLAVLVFSLGFLAVQWARRMRRKPHRA
ncbi:MAG TPA: hypothetical protein VM865_06550 [Acidobacteriaceae bacterium]|jgi:hypothetical protein|nr:hypothetical protein [Acidobacteriaceae bacterium]